MQDFTDKELIYFNDCVAYFGKPGQRWSDDGAEQVFYNRDDAGLSMGMTFNEFYAAVHANGGDVFVKCIMRDTEWRMLQPGDVIGEGDEYFEDIENGPCWLEVIASLGKKYTNQDILNGFLVRTKR